MKKLLANARLLATAVEAGNHELAAKLVTEVRTGCPWTEDEIQEYRITFLENVSDEGTFEVWEREVVAVMSLEKARKVALETMPHLQEGSQEFICGYRIAAEGMVIEVVDFEKYE